MTPHEWLNAAPTMWQTDCVLCDRAAQHADEAAGRFANRLARRMILCPDCGDKRCAKAYHHLSDCDGGRR